MSLKNKLSNMSEDELIERIECEIKRIGKLINYIKSGKAAKDLYSIMEKDIQQHANKIIKEWYDSYDRKFYKPTGSLYKSYKIISKNNEPIIVYNRNYIPKTHRVDSVNPDYIYDYIFSEGWHGGAAGIKGDEDLLYVPTPPKKFRARPYNGDDYHPWSNAPWKHNRWVLAEQTDSIKDGLDDLINYYQSVGLDALTDAFIEENFKLEE